VGEGWDEGILKSPLPSRERVGKATAPAVSNDIAVEIKKLSRRLRTRIMGREGGFPYGALLAFYSLRRVMKTYP
jgi:hypothetical protein